MLGESCIFGATLQVIIVVLLKIDPTPNEFAETAVINAAVGSMDGARAAAAVDSIIYDLDFVRLRQSCNGFKICLCSLLLHSCLS